LLQKIMRAVGSSNIDHRLSQRDFADDQLAAPYPSLETPLVDLSSLDGLLLVGANPRKEIPLLALRIRELVGAGGRVGTLGSSGIDANFDVAVESVVDPASIVDALCQLISSFEGGAEKLPNGFTPQPEGVLSPAEVTEMSDLLKGSASIILGEQALNHPSGAAIRVLASVLARVSGGAIGVIAPANSAGAWWAGVVPHRLPGGIEASTAGANAQTILDLEAKTVLLYGLEPSIDHCDPRKLSQLLDRAKNVVVFSAFRSSIPDQATLVLPIAPYTEMAGSYLNLNGLLQRSSAALDPRGGARPGWKVLRVLGNFLSLEGFEYQTTDDVIAEIPPPSTPDWHTLESEHWTFGNRSVDKSPSAMTTHFWTPLYAADPVVRRARSLDQTADAERGRRCRVHPSDLKKYDLQDGESITLSADGKKVELPIDADQNVSPGSVSIPAGSKETAALRNETHVSIAAGQRDA
jgi:NADH-quinone oxidoreductase subunit G